ncbi:winged helix-turn-helix transcriptional regulator [Mycobacterium hackensackense]|nr:winged helix-turn-helix transcriptional regulator [Mycobacterium hackensackense]
MADSAAPRGFCVNSGAAIPDGSRQISARSDPASHGYRKFCTIGGVETLVHTDALARFGHALADATRTRILLSLNRAPGYPSELAEQIGVTRQILSNHLTCLRGCGLVVAVPEGRRMRYELADPRIGHALDDLMGLVLAVDPNCTCVGAGGRGCGCR